MWEHTGYLLLRLAIAILVGSIPVVGFFVIGYCIIVGKLQMRLKSLAAINGAVLALVVIIVLAANHGTVTTLAIFGYAVSSVFFAITLIVVGVSWVVMQLAGMTVTLRRRRLTSDV